MFWDWLFDFEWWLIDMWGLGEAEKEWRRQQARPLDPCIRKRKRSFK